MALSDKTMSVAIGLDAEANRHSRLCVNRLYSVTRGEF